jgi:hypothetical protein
MQIFERRMPNDFNLWCIGDFHIGTVAFAEKPFIRMRDEVKNDKMGFVAGMGDYVEGRAIDHPYFELATTDLNTPLAYKQAEVVVKYLDPIRDKILFLLEGNHDRYSKNYIGLVENIMCKELGVPFGTWSCLHKFTFKGGRELVGHFTHGSDRKSPVRSQSPIPARQQINEKLSLINILSSAGFDADFHCCGHYHRMITYSPSQYTDLKLIIKNGDLKEQYKALDKEDPFGQYYACTGAWMRQFVNGISTYGERALYRSVSIGCIVYHIRGGKIADVVEKRF